MNNESENKNEPSLKTKAAYVGAGIVAGLVLYPFVKKNLDKAKPLFDSLMDNLTGQAEQLVEKSSDLVAMAKEQLTKEEEQSL